MCFLYGLYVIWAKYCDVHYKNILLQVPLLSDVIYCKILMFSLRDTNASVCVCVCVWPSHVGILLKRLNIGSYKQHHTIAPWLCAKDLWEIWKGERGGHPEQIAKCMWGKLKLMALDRHVTRCILKTGKR